MPKLIKRDLMPFLDRNVEKGWMNGHTGRSWKAACNKILEDAADDDDLTNLDVRSAVLRYANRHPGDLSGPSLRVYESRVKSALDAFASFIADPTTYKPRARGNGAGGADAAATAKKLNRLATRFPPRAKPVTPLPDVTPPVQDRRPYSVTETFAGHVTDTSLAMPFPMRANFLAQIVVPRDMTKSEAERLCNFVMALAIEPATIVRSARTD